MSDISSTLRVHLHDNVVQNTEKNKQNLLHVFAYQQCCQNDPFHKDPRKLLNKLYYECQ